MYVIIFYEIWKKLKTTFFMNFDIYFCHDSTLIDNT